MGKVDRSTTRPQATPERDLPALAARIAASRLFERAARSRELLHYLVEQALAGRREIHEQDIGVEVFARERGFDTGHDTIVRVQVAQLRKKLEQYFAEEGKDEPFLLEIARGSYRPVLQPRPVPAVVEIAPSAKPSRWLTPVLSAAVVILGVLSAYLGLRQSSTPPRDAAGEPSEAVAALWRTVFPPRQAAHVVLADFGVVLLQEVLNQEFTLEEYAAQLDLEILRSAPLSPDLRDLLASLRRRSITSLADVELVRHLTSVLPEGGPQLSIITSRDFNIRALNTGNTLLFGGPRSTPMVKLVAKDLDFTVEYDPAARNPFARNRNPQPGEAATYAVTPSETYAVVALVRNPTKSGRVLILSGLETVGSEAAIRLVTTEKLLAPVWAKLDTKAQGEWEILLRSRRIGGAPQETQVVAIRTH